MPSLRILIRADGDRRIGSGHVMRMLALAEATRAAGGDVHLAGVSIDPGLVERANAMGCEVTIGDYVAGSPEDAGWIVDLAESQDRIWVVADGYDFRSDYQKLLREAGRSVLFVDDHGHAEHYTADLVLNQNISAQESLYVRRAPDTELLLGPRYALLRREFESDRPLGPVARRATRVLVTMGGADPANFSARVLSAIGRVRRELVARLVVGPSNPRGEELRSLAGNDARVRIIEHADMPTEMAWADVAVTSAGSTTHELCLMGVPMLTVVLADNQRAINEALGDRGAAVALGWHEGVDVAELATMIDQVLDSRSRRQALRDAASTLVDGHGAARVVAAMVRRGGSHAA